MKDEELIELESANQPNPEPTAYELLVSQSKKMGQAATKAGQDLKHLLQQEIPVPTRTQLLHSFSLVPKLKVSARRKELSALKKLARRSSEVLVEATTVFPFTLFPHTIAMDRAKITITKRDFFWSASVVSIRVDDILNVACEVGPLFGTVTIASRVMSTVDHFSIHYLWRPDAAYLKRIIQGYVIARQNNVDVSHLSRSQLLDMLAELGG